MNGGEITIPMYVMCAVKTWFHDSYRAVAHFHEAISNQFISSSACDT